MSAPAPSLSSICPTWKGALPAAQMSALQRGVAREQERFRGRPFVLVRLLDGTDYDGFKTDLELIAGFPDEATAAHHAREQAEATLSRALHDPSSSSNRWTVVAPIETSLARESIGAVIERVALTQFKVKDGTGFGVERHVFMVVHVRAAEIIGPELFAAIGWESELRQFLVQRGTAPDHA